MALILHSGLLIFYLDVKRRDWEMGYGSEYRERARLCGNHEAWTSHRIATIPKDIQRLEASLAWFEKAARRVPNLPNRSREVATYREEIRQLRIDLARNQRRNAYWAALRRKYERAADRTWLPVPPDPPEPN